MTADNYTPSTALTSYYQTRTTRALARHWATEKLIHDLGAIGLLNFFEGPGPNPMTLTEASTSKLWLKTDAGVTSTSGTFRRWNGAGVSTDEANWDTVDPGSYLLHLGNLAPTTSVADYATRTAAAAATIDSGVLYVRTAGYTTAGDKGGALYYKVGSEPAHIAKFQSADGAWWEIAELTNIKQLGAIGDGASSTEDTAAFLGAVEYFQDKLNSNSDYGGRIAVPLGVYDLTSTLEISVSSDRAVNIVFVGDGGHPGYAATVIKITPSASAPGIYIRSGQNIRFEDIQFISTTTNTTALVDFDAQASPVFSGFMCAFRGCSFTATAAPSVAMIRVVNTSLCEFEHCWIGSTGLTSNNKIILGKTAAGTEGGGAAGQTLFKQCQLYCDIEISNVLFLTFLNTIFARVNATTPVKIYPSATDFVRQQHVTMIGCSQVSVTDGVEVTFWEQGTGSSNQGIYVQNCRFDGYKITFQVSGGGYGHFENIEFNAPTSVTGVIGIQVAANAKHLTFGPNNFSDLLTNGFIGIDDNRSGARYPLVVDSTLASNQAFASVGNYEDFISTTHQFEGGLYRIRWALAIINGAGDTTYTVRPTIDGTAQNKVSRTRTILASETQQMCGEAVMNIDGTTAAVDVKLTCRQASGGAGTAQQNGLTYASFLQIEKV